MLCMSPSIHPSQQKGHEALRQFQSREELLTSLVLQNLFRWYFANSSTKSGKSWAWTSQQGGPIGDLPFLPGPGIPGSPESHDQTDLTLSLVSLNDLGLWKWFSLRSSLGYITIHFCLVTQVWFLLYIRCFYHNYIQKFTKFSSWQNSLVVGVGMGESRVKYVGKYRYVFRILFFL